MNIDENELISRLESIREKLDINNLLTDEDDMAFAVAIAVIMNAAKQNQEKTNDQE